MRSKVVISNYWHNPGIRVTVFVDPEIAPDGGIHLEIALDDLVAGVLAEMKHPTQIWTRASLVAEVAAAVARAIEKIKMASSEGVR